MVQTSEVHEYHIADMNEDATLEQAGLALRT
jgi:hypothetical protein